MALPNQAAIDANNLLYLSLLHGSTEPQRILPVLADKLPTVRLLGDSLMALSYALRPQAAWDNGRPVSAADVAFTLKLMSCPGLPNENVRNQYRFVQDIVADSTNPRHFTLLCRGQSPDYVLASGDFFVLPEAALDPQHTLRRYSLAALQRLPPTVPADTVLQRVAQRYRSADIASHPGRITSCGPYQLASWQKDRYLTFRRKPRWWAEQLAAAPLPLQARAPQLNYVIIPDVNTATLALRRGDLDVFPQLPARDFARLQASAEARRSLQFHSTASYDVVMAGFNTQRPVLAQAATRRALSRLFDAPGLLRAIQGEAGMRSVGILSPLDRANYNDSLALIPFDPAGAAALLRAAGWQRTAGSGWSRPVPGGPQALRLTVRYRAADDMYGTIALQFRAAAASLGIPVTLQPSESGTFASALNDGDFDVYIRTLRGNPFVFNFTPLLHSVATGASNPMRFGTPGTDRLIEAIVTAGDARQRALLLRRFQAALQREAPLVPLFVLPNRVVARRGLTGLHVSSLKPGFWAASIERAVQPTP